MTLLVKNWKPSNIYMAIFTTFPSLLAIEILGNGRFRSLKVDFAFFNRKKKFEFFGKNSTNILFHSSPHWHLPIFFLSIFAVFLHHWFFDFDFLCSSRPYLLWHVLCYSSTTRFMQHVLFSSHVNFLMIFIFLILSFSLQFPLVYWFLPLHARPNAPFILFYFYHSPSIMLLKAFLTLLVFYSSIWSLFDFFLILLFFPSLTLYSSCIFFFQN